MEKTIMSRMVGGLGKCIGGWGLLTLRYLPAVIYGNHLAENNAKKHARIVKIVNTLTERTFQRYDVNRDETLDEQELLDFFLLKYDRDGDGQLNRTEIEQYHSSVN